MNANAIIPGLEYAYTNYPSRNKQFYQGCKRIRVMHVYKLEPPENSWTYYNRSRKVTLVECVWLDTETGEARTEDNYGSPVYIWTVEPRYIVSRWDEYLVEKERHDKKQAEEEARREALRKEREEHYRRIEEARREKAERERLAKVKEEEDIRQYISTRLNVPPESVYLPDSYSNRDFVFVRKEEVKKQIAEQNSESNGSQESTSDSETNASLQS